MAADVIPDEEGNGVFAHAECDECSEGWRGPNRTYWGVARRDAERHNERLHPEPDDREEKRPMTRGTDLIAAERVRQITEEGYTPEHDADHAWALIRAGALYADQTAQVLAGKPHLGAGSVATDDPWVWPWHPSYWKPTGDPVRDLVKAGALIAAAIDSLTPEPDDREEDR